MPQSNNTIWILGGLAVGGMLLLRGKSEEALENKDLSNILQWYGIAQAEAVKNDIETSLILAIIWQESSGRINPPHSSGETGLMGLKDIIVKDVGYSEASSQPSKNIKQGTEAFALIKSLTGNTYDALRAYKERGTNIEELTATEGSWYADDVLEKKTIVERELGKLTFTEQLAIGSQGGALGIATTIGRKITSIFNGFFE